MKHLSTVFLFLLLALAARAQRPQVGSTAAPSGPPPVGVVADVSPWSHVVDSLLLPLDKS